MKEIIYILISVLLVFSIGCFLLREYLDTTIFLNTTCVHPEKTTAFLYWKPMYQGEPFAFYCYWYVGGSTRISAYWDNCRDYEQSQTIPWEQNNYSCDDLLSKTLSSSSE